MTRGGNRQRLWTGIASTGSMPVGAILAVIATLAGLVAPSRAGAGEQHELLLFEEPVVTAAAKHAQTLEDAPAAVSVVTQADIRRFGYRTLAEALQSVGGFYASNDRSYEYVGVRGFLIPGDYNDRILLLVNGHTYNNDIYQQAPLGTDFGIDMEDIERIEVVRGPGSALYGGNAVLAVINVVTATAVTRPGVQALAQVGSFDSLRGHTSLGHVFENGVEVFAAGSFEDTDGPAELYYPEYDNPDNNFGIARHTDGEQNFRAFLNARYGDFSFQGGASGRNKEVPTGAYGTIFNDRDNTTEDGRYFAELDYSARVVADIDLSARVFYDRYRYEGAGPYDYGPEAPRVLNIEDATSDWFGGELRGRRSLFTGNTLTLGGEYSYHPDAEITNADADGTTYVDVDQSFDWWGIYVQDEWTVHPTVNLVAGVRYDSYYDRISNWSPRAGVIWRPLPRTTVKLLYGQAFRAPNLYELYYGYPRDGCPVQLPNPSLDPEQITTYEGVLEQEIWGGITGRVDVFHWQIDDLVQEVTFETDDGGEALQFENSGTAQSTGTELELRVPLPYDILARSTYSLQVARGNDGAALTNSPIFLLTNNVLFPLPWAIEGGAELVVVAPRETLAGNTVETAVIANLTLGRRDLLGRWLPGIDGWASFYNLFDQHYSDPASEQFRQDAIEQDGFTFRLQLRYAFQP